MTVLASLGVMLGTVLFFATSAMGIALFGYMAYDNITH